MYNEVVKYDFGIVEQTFVTTKKRWTYKIRTTTSKSIIESKVS